MSMAQAAQNWLDAQEPGRLLIAREILARREETRLNPGRNELQRAARRYDHGVIDGLRRALSFVSDRPGDISDTGAEGFIQNVRSADEMLAEAKQAEG